MAGLGRRASLHHDHEHGMFAGGESLEDDPDAPLVHKATLKHHDSIFSLLIFAPPLSRMHVGHYWSGTVLISLALTIILLTTQFGLTIIAGQNIRTQSAAFKKSLVAADAGDMLPEAMTPMSFVAGRFLKLGDDVPTATQTMSDVATIAKMTAPAKSGPQCCNGAECAAMHLQCCDRSDVVIGAAPTANASFLLAMPKTVDENKPKYIGRSWDEICYRHDHGMLDCTPPSYLFMDAWEELDTNQDGVWSMQEAVADKANLGCRFGASASEMFRSACRGITKDAQDTSVNSYSMPIVPTEIEKRQAIPKAYFHWWQALTVMCVVPSVHRCSELVQSGMFDGAIKMYRESEVSRGGVADLDTALDFCQRMLSRNGICEKTLPGSYLMYRSRVTDKCGDPTFVAAGKVRNPFDQRDAMSVMKVNYNVYDAYTESAGITFQIFIYLILMVWYLSLMHEFQSIIVLIDFTVHFPINGSSPCLTPKMEQWLRDRTTGEDAGPIARLIGKAFLPTDEPHEECTGMQAVEKGTFWNGCKEQTHILVIDSHSIDHLYLCAVMCAVRLFLLLYMADVGTSFLIYTRDYSELLMNAVALAFIFKLPEFLYVLVVSDAVKDKLQGAQCNPFPTTLARRGWIKFWLAPTTWGLTFIPLFTGFVVYWNLSFNTIPFLDALQCACYQTGPNCNVAPRFEKAWWDTYWQDNAHLAKTRASWFQG